MKAELIPIEKIKPNPNQPRTNIDNEEITELVNSIKDVGVIQPILVTPRNDNYLLVAGSRRLEASKQANLTEIPCILQDLSDDDLLRYALLENLQREDLEPLEEAIAIKQLISTQKLEYRKVAELIGKSKSFVGERLALLNLPDDLKEAVSRGTISMKKADVLKSVKNDRLRTKLLEKAPQLDLPTLRALVENAENKVKSDRKPSESWNINQGLQKFAKSNEGVRIYKDRISFKFESEDSLRDLLAKLLEMLK